jgi:hypothetical protein
MVLWFAFAVTSPVVSAQDPTQTELKSSGKDESRVYEVGSRTRVKIGGVSVGAGYARFSSPLFYGPYSYPNYGWDFAGYPWWPYSGFWSPLYFPGLIPGFAQSVGKGEIKLDSSEKDAEVYIDGAYAGMVRDLKSIWLDAGAYDLELKGEGDRFFQKRIYILSGKSLKISAMLSREPREVTP